MIAFRVLTMDEAIRSVNHETLILLFGMMIVVANLRLSGFFAMVSAWVVEHTSLIERIIFLKYRKPDHRSMRAYVLTA